MIARPLALALVLGLAGSALGQAIPEESTTISVLAGPRQVFEGFGVSLGNWGRDYGKLTADERDRLGRFFFEGLRVKVLRLWVNLDEYAPAPDRHDLRDFLARYVDSNLVADARRHGVSTLLLAPDAMPANLKAKRPGGPGDFALRDDALGVYAELITDLIARARDEGGIMINATGVQNEPNDLDRIAPDQMAAIVKALRRALDARGLEGVAIIAPEAANVDQTFFDAVAKLKADPAAWASVAGLASHSYGMAATEEAARAVEGKSYWMTEASDNGAEGPGDAARAASLASRFLNDVNHRTTHWVHFLGFEVPDPNDNATRILAYSTGPLKVRTFHKYYAYRQLSRAFDPGATFRHCTSSAEGEMNWTYGKKPHLNAASARNPDGSWSVGLSNFTAPGFTDDPNEPNSSANGGKARRVVATVRVAELAREPETRFEARRTGPHLTDAPEVDVVARNGELKVEVGPLEIVTLRSRPAAR